MNIEKNIFVIVVVSILFISSSFAHAQEVSNINKCNINTNAEIEIDPQMGAVEVLGKGLNFFKSNLSSSENSVVLNSVWYDHRSFINSCYNGPTDPGITEKSYRYYSDMGELQSTLAARLNIDASKNFLSTFKTTIDAYYSSAQKENYNIQGIELMQSALGRRHDIDFDCAQKWRINPTVLDHAKQLKPVTDHEHDKTAWVDYGDFFENHGTHIIISTTSGTLIRESSFTSTTQKYTETQLKANACANYEGIDPQGKKTFDACINVSKEEREASQNLVTEARDWYQGGTLATRNALSSSEPGSDRRYACTLQLLNEAKESTVAINIRTKPIWEILTEHFRDQDDGEKYIPQMRAMEQYYIGLRSFNCQEIKSPKDETWFLRKFQYDETRSTDETPVYRCVIQKPGCHGNSSCKKGKKPYHKYCYCFGDQCVEHNEKNIPAIRGEPHGHHYNSPNDTCDDVSKCSSCNQSLDDWKPIWEWQASMQETGTAPVINKIEQE